MKHLDQNGKAKYPPQLKLAYALGIENALYPQSFLKKVPYSTRNYWRSNALKRTNSGEVSQLDLSNIEELLNKKNFVNKDVTRLKTMYQEYNDFLISCLGRKGFLDLLEDNKESFVKWLNKQSKTLSKKEILELLNVSESRFQNWQAQVLFKCDDSPIAQCAKISTQQITKQEAYRVKRLVLTRKNNLNVAWAEGVRKKNIKISLSTFYKYVKILGLAPNKNKRKKPKYPLIRAKKAHDIWHADISVIPTLDGNKSYLYVIMDNYSRAILSYRVEKKIRGRHSLETLKAAYESVAGQSIEYITDGGSENTTKDLQAYIAQCNYQLKHLIARKDIKQSNSMIERIFKTLKGEFSAILEAENHDELLKITGQTVDAYNNRPHTQHYIYTPNEVLKKEDGWLNVKAELAKGAKERLEKNRNCKCTKCDCKNGLMGIPD